MIFGNPTNNNQAAILWDDANDQFLFRPLPNVNKFFIRSDGSAGNSSGVLSGAGFHWDGQMFLSSTDRPLRTFRESSAPGATVGEHEFQGRSSTNVIVGYASIASIIVTNTNNSEDGDFVIKTATAGAVTEKVRVGFDGSVTIQETAINPANPSVSNEARVYIKNDKYIIQFNDAGTTRYKYLDLTCTTVTWIHTTVAP